MRTNLPSLRSVVPLGLSLFLIWPAVDSRSGEAAQGKRGIVATVNAQATEAGIRAMQNGGNAIDAAVAAALTLGVADGHNSGIGGGCFMLIRLANGSMVAIDGRETAPMGARRDMFVRDGKADTQLSQLGALAIGVPGALAAYDYAIKQHGRLALKDHLLPAAQIATNGFRLSSSDVRRLSTLASQLKKFEATRDIFFGRDGQAFKAGEMFKQVDLARSYRAIAEQGIDWFYKGPFAKAAEAWMKENGGVLTAEDFRKYRVKLREPVRTTYRDFEIVGFPPPSSGGVHVAQILNMLESFDLKSMGASSADFVHVSAEAMKLAFADRAHWLGDPDFAPIPRGLIAKPYARKLARQIQMDRVGPVSGHGIPDRAGEDVFGKHTTHFSTADADGNWVACTATINTSYGSKVVIPGTGVVMNNEMDDFSVLPGVRNFFGLVGAEANAVAPGKRPLSSMSPTIVLKDGQPILAVGAAGGPTIISQTLLAITRTIDFSMPIEKALAEPRFHHQWHPDELKIEKKSGSALRRELARRGHKLEVVNSLGVTQAVARDPERKVFVGAHDPRVEGRAEGF